MIIKRFFPNRWARITAWTAAAVAWVTSLLVIQADRALPAGAVEPPPPPATTIPETATTLAPIPEATDRGLVVLRFTPTPAPPPEVITRTVVVSGGGSPSTPAPEPVRSSGS